MSACSPFYPDDNYPEIETKGVRFKYNPMCDRKKQVVCYVPGGYMNRWSIRSTKWVTESYMVKVDEYGAGMTTLGNRPPLFHVDRNTYELIRDYLSDERFRSVAMQSMYSVEMVRRQEFSRILKGA